LLTKILEIDMRKIFIFLVFLASLGVLSCVLHSPPDCATEFSRCVQDPPLFAKLQAMNASVYCEKETKACRGREARMVAEAAAEFARRKAEYVEFSSAY
jgi:hypothetical protein